MCELVFEYSQEEIEEVPELAAENKAVNVDMCEAYKQEFKKLTSLSCELWDISDWLRVVTYDAGFAGHDEYVLETEEGFNKVVELHEQHNKVMAEYLEVKKKAENIKAVCRR